MNSSLQSKKSPERVKSAKFTSSTIQNDDTKQLKEKNQQNIESTSTSKASLRSTNLNAHNDDENSNKKTRKQRNNSKGSQSRSPDYQTNVKPLGGNSNKKSSSKSPRRKPKSSKSPKRKQTGKRSSGRNDESSINFSASLTEFPKSTAELEDLSSQGLTLINTKIFQSTLFHTFYF